MCDKCNFVESDGVIEIGSDAITITASDGREIETHQLAVFMLDDKQIEAAFWMGTGCAAARVDVDIKYCPFCGRKL